MKKSILIIACTLLLTTSSCIINNPEAEDCAVISAEIIKITEGTSYDIVFTERSGERYYINRGLEQNLNLDNLNASVLNKTVTLHLPKFIIGTSNHIAQLAIKDDVIFTEFD